MTCIDAEGARERVTYAELRQQSLRILGAVALQRGRIAMAARRLGEAARLDPEHASSDLARTTRELSGGFYAPMRLFLRLGPIRSWVAFVLVYGHLRTQDDPAAIYLFIGWWAIWGWMLFSMWVLSQRLDQ